MQIPRAGRGRLLHLALKGPDTKGNTAWREESPMCTISSWSTLTDAELSLYMVFGELHIRGGRAIPSSESHNFQHLKLRRVVSGTSFREVVKNVAKAIIFNGNTSLKYYSFCNMSWRVAPYIFAENRAIFVAICWKDINGFGLPFQESSRLPFLQSTAVNLCKCYMKQLSATFCTVLENLFSAPWNSENMGKMISWNPHT